MFYDHDYEGDGGPCQALVPKYNHEKDHDYPMAIHTGFTGEFCTKCDSRVRFEELEGLPGAGQSFCNCNIPYSSENWVCMKDMKPYEDVIHARLTDQPCGSPKSSVLHPVEGHWCSALENGWDCMHFED